MGSMKGDWCSLKTTGLWIYILLIYLYGTCQSASAESCSMTLTASKGEITSPGYPGNYNDNLDCTYVIVGGGQTHTINIVLVQLDLETNSGCSYDWLTIDGGPKMCSNTRFLKTYVFRHRFVIKFRSDGSNTGRGFQIQYSIDANDTCTAFNLKTSGQISTPCYACNCTYNNCTNTIIGSGKLQTLILDFVSLNFKTSSNCDLGWFNIDGGPRICTSSPFKTTYAFVGIIDIVTHGGDRSVDSCAGFVANYVVEDTCLTTLTASEGEITNPYYFGTAYNYLTCTYVIVGDGKNQSITIDLVKLDLEVTYNCDNDWLVIADGHKLCRDTTFHKTYVFRDRFIIKFRTDYRSTSRGFKMHYSVGVDAQDSCTSIHLTTSGQISTPCYSCNCTYNNFTNTIIGNWKLQTLTLDFVSLNFTTSANCDLGWFTIDGGPRICTSTPFKTTHAFFGSIDIVTNGGGRSVNSAGFVVNYVVEDTCSTTLIASEGEITSPGYPGIPYNYLTCTYVIVGDGQNQSINIDLLQLDLEAVSDCANDWLIIDDGPKLCYQTTFHKTYVFRDKFHIKFRSDYRSTSRGFKMHYSVGEDAQDTCTSTHLTTSGQISTSCYSCNCTDNTFTNTIIGSGRLQALILDFVSLNFTNSANCDLGWFTIDGGPRICASTPFKTTYAFFGSIDIVNYCGDQSVDSCGGFVVNYVVEDNCSTTLTASEGEITSPGNTGTPYNYLTCTYVIVGDGQNQSITIDLVKLDLEVTYNCNNDWLIIDGGPKFCRNTTFHKTYVFRDRFIIKFRSDYRSTSRGFKMHYSVGVDGHDNCTSIHSKTSGQISTTCYSCNCTNNDCTNTIIGNWKMQTLTLDFVSLNFTTSANCDLGWFTIDGGPKLCASRPFKTTYAFFGSVDIVTHGGHQSVGSCAGFVANYVVEDNCSTTLTTNEGEITSHAYPGTAYTYLTCTYVIVGDGQNQSIAMDLLQLDVNEGSDCSYDWLIIDDGPKLCSSRTTFHKTYVFWDRFIIKFRSDYRSDKRGFNIHYSVGVDAHDNCTSTHLTTSGQISTPCYSCNCTYNNFTNAIIGSGKLQTLIIDFVSLNFTTSADCDFGWFTIDGGPKLCTSTPFKTTYAFFGSVDIVTHGVDQSGDFVVNYIVEDNCSTTLTASEGEITSPGYPGIPYNYLTCTYVVVGNGQNQSIAIDLVQLDLQEGSDCSYDWLVIDNGPNLCRSRTTFHKTYIFRDRFIIKFRTDYRSKTRGFKIRYSIGVDAHDTCTSTHLKKSAQISTPCYSCNCTNNTFTNTIIGSGKLQTLTLDFVSLNYTTSSNCDLGWFTIDGGPKICTSTPFKTTYAFFGSVDIVTHGGGRSVNSAGFVVNYVVEDNCSTTFTASEGEITSPGYPGIPYNYLTCTYVVVGDGQNQSITIDLLQLDLTSGSNCPYNWLIIDDGPNLCYETTFHKTYAFQDKFIIKFRSDYRSASYGFKMHYSVGVDANDTCTSTHLTTSGQISTPCYSCNCTYNNCTNTIIGSGKMQTLTLDFVSLIFTTSTNCDLGWFTIDGGKKLCTSTPFKTTYAFFGSADIVTHGGGRSVDSCGGFVVDYVVEDVDNNKLTYTTNSGQLVGPLFPGASSSSRVTTTYIIVGHVPKQSLILDITLRSYSSGCYYVKLTLNGTEDLCDTGRYSRTYFSQNNFTIEFLCYYYGSSFLIHYEKEDITKATSPTVSSSITSTATTGLSSSTPISSQTSSTALSLSTTSAPTTTETSSTASTATTRPPYIAMTDVGLDEDCTHAHCSVIHSACVMDETGDRRCECVQNYLKTVNGHCKQAPTMLVANDTHDIAVKGSQHVGDMVGSIPFIPLADFSRSEFQITVNILPAGSGITAQVTPTDITLKSTSNTENTQTDIVLQIDAHVHYIHISQVVSVHIVFEEITVNTQIVHLFLYEGTRAATIIGDTTQFTSRYGQSGYKLSITSNDKSDIVEALFLLQDSGQIVLKKDVALQSLTGSSLVASIEISFQVNLTRDSASEAVVLAVYHILILNDEYHYTIDENNSPNKAIMQNQLLGDHSFFKITAPDMSSVLKFQNNNVLVREQLDYEIVSDRETEFDLYVSTNDADGSTDVRMSGKLFVKNVNDKLPQFEELKLYLTVLSGSPKGTILGIIPVTDQDTPLSGLTLSINGPYSAYFIIDNGGTLSSSTDIHIGPSKFPHNFNFLVSASDGELTSDNNCIVDVTIRVANQHTTNLNVSFLITLPEESHIGTFVADVRQINYTNYLFTEREAYSYFHLNKTTGNVTTARRLDRETSTDAHTDFGISGHMEDQDMCTFIIIGELHTTLSDINDNSPVFHCPACASVKVKENVELGSVLIEGSIQDDDEGKNGQSNFVINDTSAFTIETSNGKSFKIRVHTKLDRETVPAYYLTIYAVDGAVGSEGRQTSSTYLNIKVEDVNDNPPVFTTTVTSFHVQENQAGVLVTTLNATDRDAGLNGKVSFLIKSGGLGFFSINNGTLKTTKGIDREAYASFDLNIEAFDAGSPQLRTYRNVTIDIIDVNDNAPVFHGIDGQVFKVEENTPCSTDIVTATATDLDTGNNSVIVYSLGGNDSHMFSVDSHNGGIRCKTPLDYERKSVYKDLILLATDQGHPPLNSTSAITVKVLDVNDNPPMFSKSSYEVNVTNTPTKGSIPLLPLSVHDADSGKNGEVSLSIASTQYHNIFTVTSKLIRLTTSPQLTNKDYVFNVIANDGGTPSLSATTTVTVHVDRSVSNGVKFKDTDFNLTAIENIDYTTKVIGNVSVTNSGGSPLTFSIDPEFGKWNFSIDNAGDIFFAGTFDREIQDSYNLIVRANQHGAVAVVHVHVEDVNDNPPIFTLQSDQLIFSEPEDVNVDTIIATVTASDKDAGENGHVTYTLYPTTDFSIHPTKGKLMVANGLDADDPSPRSYKIRITATDNGGPRKSATVTATVFVTDVNDNSPVFSSPTYSFNVKENAAVNSEVATIQATDNDYRKDTNGLVSYDMATSTQPCPFFIKEVSDPNTNDVQGSIQVKETLDYESVRAYTCIVTAHDNPERSSQKSSTATVNIAVEDVNDNVPFFLNEPYIANVSREGAEKTFTFNVTADDVDTDAVNGQIQYSLADDLKTTNPLFKIDPFTGTVSVVDSLATVPDLFNLTITAKDTKHSNSTTLTINIIDNNLRPMFIKPKYTISIVEEREILKPLILTKVTAKDDNKPTCNCTYEIDGSEYFTVDKTTGSVLQVKSVDRETTGNNITLQITATDHGSPPKSTATLLVINILDVNDNAPFFSHGPQKFTVSQKAPINTVINHVAYTDLDEPSTSRPRFTTIFNTNNSIRLREDGALIVTQPLWNPEMESYNIRIVTQVLDSKNVTRALPEHTNYTAETNTAQVIVTIHQKNNTYAPQFTQGTYTTELSTTARSSQEVPVRGFKAVDKDGDNITYAILSGNFRDTFRINSVTGAITLTYDIDVHVPDVINLTIKATDDAEVFKTGTCLVQITLEGSSSRQCYSPSELSRQVASNTSPQTQFIAPLGVTAGLLALAIIVCLVLIVKLRLTKRNDTSVTNATTNQTSYSNLSKARETPEPYEPLADPNRFSQEPVTNPGYISHDRSRTSACTQPPPLPSEPRPVSDEQLLRTGPYRRGDGGRSYDDRERSRLPRY